MDKFSKIRRILILILILNWGVAFCKIVYGLITKCASMTADGVHSLGDGASNIIGLVGIWAASKPTDKEHPYGHRKFETFATLGIAAMLFFGAFEIARNAFLRLFNPVVPDVTVLSFGLMLAMMAINLLVMKYEHKKGHQLLSDVLICDALHTRSDFMASSAVILTLIAIKMGFPFLDTVAAFLIALLIAKAAFNILKAGSDVLCDAQVLPESAVKDVVKKIPGVEAVHKIRTRGRKDDIYVDLHVNMDPEMYVKDAHKLSHKIQAVLKNEIPGVTDVIVHIEPSGNQ
jgi:cation diffusion facilitator family transporter